MAKRVVVLAGQSVINAVDQFIEHNAYTQAGIINERFDEVPIKYHVVLTGTWVGTIEFNSITSPGGNGQIQATRPTGVTSSVTVINGFHTVEGQPGIRVRAQAWTSGSVNIKFMRVY